MGEAVYTIRRTVAPADITRVRDMVTSTGFFSTEEIGIAMELVETRLAQGEASGYFFMFYEEGGVTRGYTCYGPIPGSNVSYDLYWIAVDAAYRGSGIGRILDSVTADEIRTLGGLNVYAETSSRDQYRPTRAFYERCGYEKAAYLENFYDIGDGKVIYHKKLGTTAYDT